MVDFNSKMFIITLIYIYDHIINSQNDGKMVGLLKSLLVV